MKKYFRLLTVMLTVILLAGCGNGVGHGASQAAESGEALHETVRQTAAETVPEGRGESLTKESYDDTADSFDWGAAEDAEVPEENAEETDRETDDTLPEDGEYSSKEDVALYIYLYGHLPDNYITTKEAEKLGWPGGSLEPYAPGKCIGGSRFGNYEGLLPEKEGRSYTEDHYQSFELLYGEE